MLHSSLVKKLSAVLDVKRNHNNKKVRKIRYNPLIEFCEIRLDTLSKIHISEGEIWILSFLSREHNGKKTQTYWYPKVFGEDFPQV